VYPWWGARCCACGSVVRDTGVQLLDARGHEVAGYTYTALPREAARGLRVDYQVVWAAIHDPAPPPPQQRAAAAAATPPATPPPAPALLLLDGGTDPTSLLPKR
jgi:hypothetical protein